MTLIGYDESCLGCILRELIELLDSDYNMNRNKMLEMLFVFNSKYNKNEHKILEKVRELESLLENGSTRDEIFYMVDIIGLQSDFIAKHERQQLQDLMFKSGNSGSVVKRSNRLIKEFDKNSNATLVK